MASRRLAALAYLALVLTGAAGPPSDRQLDNLAAFARLLSLVRFFHPSDQAAAADWNRVAVAGVAAVEDARDPESLAHALESFFQPFAPTLRVVAGGRRPETPPELRPPADGRPVRIVAWRHYGGKFDATTKVFSSERIDDQTPPGFGTLAQALLPGALSGQKIRLRIWARSELETGGQAQLGLRVDRAGGASDRITGPAIREREWRLYEVEADVPADSERILILLIVSGGGRVWLDEVSLAGRKPAVLGNPGFDEGETGAQPPGWLFPYESIRAGYHLLLRREGCRQGGCAEIVSDPIAVPRFAKPADVLQVDLGAGVTAALPTALYADDRGTLPHRASASPPAVDPISDTREARLAAVTLAWGLLQHLHPYLQPDDPERSAGLRSALAAASSDQESFLRAARRLLVPLHDTRASFFPKSRPDPQSLPLAWEWIEGRPTVTGVAEGVTDVRPGDVIESLDGRPVQEVLAEEESAVSGATPDARRWRALEHLLYGPAGSKVKLGLARGGEVSLSRDTRFDQVPSGTPLPAVTEPGPGIVYVDLGRLEEEGFEPLLPRLAAARGLVFDLRRGSNVSNALLAHLTDRAVESPQWQVPVVLFPDHRGIEWLTTFWTVAPKKPRLPRAAFLVDARTDGYSETQLGIIERYRLGEIVGSRSGGNNGSTNWTDLPGGYRLLWTGQRVLKHDGSPWHGVGVAPTVPAERTLAGVAAGRDEVIEAAVAALSRR